MKSNEEQLVNSEESIQHLHRINIYLSYLRSDIYKGIRISSEKRLRILNREFLCELNDRDATENDSSNIVRTKIVKNFQKQAELINTDLYKITSVKHGISQGINKFTLKNRLTQYEQFPLTFSGNANIPLTLTLQFDLTRGIQDQFTKAKVKIKDAIRTINNESQDSTPLEATTRRSFQNISLYFFTYNKREEDKKNKYTWDATSRTLNLKVSTARYQHRIAKSLIESGEIAKYFPRFI